MHFRVFAGGVSYLMRSYAFSAYGFLFNYALFICTFFCCLSVVFQAEEFVVYFPPGGFGGIGYLPSATDRFIVPFDFYFGFGMAGGPGTVFC